MLAGCVATFALVLAVVDPAVPPKLSKSLSFNSKAKWLRDVRRCDVLVLGSSMALNNIDGRELQGLAPGGVVVNAGSWALRLDEARALYEAMEARCKPAVVVIPLYYGDFSHPPGKKLPSKAIRWDWVDRYLGGQGAPLAARMQTDLSYAIDTWRKLNSTEYRSNAYYTSLEFDASGAVLLEDRFNIEPKRWTGYRSQSSERVDPVEYSRLADLLRVLSRHRARVLVVRTPMTAEATRRFDTPYVQEQWRRVARVVQDEKAKFVDLSGMALPDDRFADFCHFKGPGARIVTRQLVSESGLRVDNAGGPRVAAQGTPRQ